MLGRLLPWWQGKLFVLSCSASWPPTAYLRGWGFSPQKPQRRTLEQNPAEVRRWLAEMGVRSDATAGRSWAPVGQTPVIKGTGKRFRVNMLSAISNAGRLLRDSGGRKVHLIVDGIRSTGPRRPAPGLGAMPSALSSTFCPAIARS
jgi:hypothetical protein